MKKIISLILLFLLVLPFVIGCYNQQESKYKSYVCNATNDGTMVTLDVNYWTGLYNNNENADKTKHVVFNDAEYVANYSHSTTGFGLPYEINEYNSTDKNYNFYYRSDNDELTYFRYANWYKDEEYFANPISLDEARIIADEIAEKYININDYVVSMSENHQVSDDYPYYHFMYVKYIDGIPTYDYIGMSLSINGKLFRIGWTTLGMMNNVKGLNIDMNDVDVSVLNKVHDLYSDKYTYTYEKESQQLTYTPENELAIITVMKLNLTEKTSLTHLTTYAFILTILEED